MSASVIEDVRRFNRTVTQHVGALSAEYLARDRPLGEARVLWEIGVDGCEVRTLRNRLELDSGHASRLLRSLEAAGLVRVEPSPADRRVRIARLTEAGRAERAILDARSDALAESMLARVGAADRDALVHAMRTVARLLTLAAVEIRPVDPAHPDARQCLRAYFAELDARSESGFDPGASLPVEAHELLEPGGCLLLAYVHDEPAGCGAVRHHAGGPSEIKRLWVAPAARGLGLGRRLLAQLESRAALAGAPGARLDSNRALTEAIALYRSTGYREVPAFNGESFADHWFEKAL